MLGKWSLIDLYVLVMSMSAFRIHINSPECYTLPINFYVVDLVVTPVWGLYAFCIAATGCLFINHVLIHYHRDAVSHDNEDFHDANTANAAADAVALDFQKDFGRRGTVGSSKMGGGSARRRLV